MLFALLLPMLLLGPVVGGQSTWFHSHGEAQAHVHLLPAHGADLHEWHATQHADADDDAHHEDHGTPPVGCVVHVPPLLVASYPTALRAERVGSWCIAMLPTRQAPAACRHYRADAFHSGWPPDRGQRSGVVELLRSSHAILI